MTRIPPPARHELAPERPTHAASVLDLMKSPAEPAFDRDLFERITARAFAQMQQMIYLANTRKDKEPGDPKVGGHPASCASSMHLLAALHLLVREPQDFVCCKPHASPVDHALHHLLQLFRREQEDRWLEVDEAKRAMHCLRKFATLEWPDVFQSYHARTDPDSFHFLPSGSVGIPPVVSVYMALAYRYAEDHGWTVPKDAHFWSLIGDSEFREGSLLECLPDVAERQLGSVTWIIDYNRQNLDGTRIPNERSLHGADCDRIERTAIANGWRVIQLRHGALREQTFGRANGDALRELFEGGFSDYEYQMLLLARDAGEMRARAAAKVPRTAELFERLDDAQVRALFEDLGGHDLGAIVRALSSARANAHLGVPTLVIAHTLKGWGLDCVAQPSNHSALPNKKEMERLLGAAGLTWEDPFALFAPESPEGRALAARRDLFRAGVRTHLELRESNRRWVRAAIEKDGGLPRSLGIDLSLFPVAHTQWMWGQLAAKLVRIGTADEGGPAGGAPGKELNAEEQRWKTAADFVLTLSPDVGTSTNISPAMDQRIYGPDIGQPLDEELEFGARHPQLVTNEEVWTRHIRFEIAEANCMSAVAAFGRLAHYTGLPFFPIMTVYDFFIKRALDQLYYNLYWGAEFVIMGTPSGVTLSPEGAQHSWKSDIQIPNLITWEPLFALEMDWILSDAIVRHMQDRNDHRRGILIRAVTRGVPQRLLLENLRAQASSKAQASQRPLKPRGAGAEWGAAQDESELAPLADELLLERARADCLAGGYYLVDWRGYAGYEPGENVVHVFAMGSPTTEALAAADKLLQRGIFANVIVISSPELLLGILGEHDGYRHLCERLEINGDLHTVAGAGASEAGLISLAGRRVPIVAVCDGEAGLLDNIGSIVGVKQVTLAVRKFSKCGRPSDVYGYQHLDSDSIVEAAGRALAETALENLSVSPELLARLAGSPTAPRPNWRELWPNPRVPEPGHGS